MFIGKSNKIHGKTYDYSETEYIHGKEKIKIKCNKHGIFEMLPINHLKGHFCHKKILKINTVKQIILY